jgi:nucleotide-binding universal stress UspA family protein
MEGVMKPFAVSSILAPTDLSDSSIPALEYAGLFAERFAAKLAVLFSDPIVYPVDVLPPGSFFVTANPNEELRLKADLQAYAAPILGRLAYDVELTVGQPIPAILATAAKRHADLIVMGTHLRHGWRRALLGSVSEGVLHGSHCPVLTVSAREHPRYGAAGKPGVTKVLCPVNFTEVGREGLQAASNVAETFGAELVVVHVIEPDEVADPTGDEERVRRWIAPELRNVVRYRQLVMRGGAAERVLDCADDVGVDLIVAGAQHRLFRDATVIGSTTERLIRFAPCPVLIVPREREAPRKERAEKERDALAGVA